MFVYLITNDNVGLIDTYELPAGKICYQTGLTQSELVSCKEEMRDKVLFYDDWIRIPNLERYQKFTGPKNETAKEKERMLVPPEVRAALFLSLNNIDDGNTNGTKRTKMDEARRRKILETLGEFCNKCGTNEGNLECDHIEPLWAGGEDSIKNIQVLCSDCHSEKTAEETRKRNTLLEKMDRVSDFSDTPNNHKSIINNNIYIKGIKRDTLVKGVSKPSAEQMQEIAEKYQVPLYFVESKWEDVENYCQSTGKKYRDYVATLRNWVKRDALKIRQEDHARRQSTSKIDFIEDQTS